MIDLFTILYFVIAYVVVWPRLYTAIYQKHREEFPTLEWDTGDRVFGIFWGGLVTTFWPLLASGWVVWKVVDGAGILRRLEHE